MHRACFVLASALRKWDDDTAREFLTDLSDAEMFPDVARVAAETLAVLDTMGDTQRHAVADVFGTFADDFREAS
jgi:hypothetical protein